MPLRTVLTPIFIDTQSQLDSLCETLAQESMMALDTEFIRVRTFYPKPGLIQIATTQDIYLVDPLVMQDWQAFSDVMTNPDIVKVLHACDEDIELFYHLIGTVPVNVFDTQIAAACCGFDFSMGYQRLVKAILDVDLEKSASRSDWTQRPLSTEQLHYAADDVAYLLEIYGILQGKLAASGLEYVVEAEYLQLTDVIRDTEFKNAFQRIKLAWKLNGHQLARLKSLAIWREKTMREKDLPRNKVANNEALMTMSKRMEWAKPQLFSVEGLPEATARHSAESLLSVLNADYEAEDRLPKPLKSDRLLNMIKETLADFAEKENMAEQLLAKKAYNELLYWTLKGKHDSLPDAVNGWRRDYYLKAKDALANQYP